MTTIDPVHQDQPISDDQELATVLAGMQQKNEDLVQPVVEPTAAPAQDMQYEEINNAIAATPPLPEPAAPAEPAITSPVIDGKTDLSITEGSLDEIKRQALEELRPLATKLELPADEKFDALLLIIRSTDDKSLIGAAHNAAKEIKDEQKRAQALFDIVKEIDYFATSDKVAE